MSLVKCPECKKEMSSNAGACPSCGFAKPKRKSFGCGALIVVLIIGGYMMTMFDTANKKPSSTTANSKNSAPAKTLTPEEVLSANLAKVESAEAAYNETQSSLKQYYASRADVAKNTESTAFAKQMIETYKADQSQTASTITKKSRELLPKLEKQFRILFASTLEDSNMKNGLNMTVKATGSDAKTLTMKYALMSKTLVYQLQNEHNIDDSAKAAGFKNLVMTNGFESSLGQTWTIDLTK